jgi:hypothetical protein
VYLILEKDSEKNGQYKGYKYLPVELYSFHTPASFGANYSISEAGSRFET